MINGRNGAKTKPARVIRRNLAGLGHDLVTLMQLQTQLLLIDVREAKARSALPAVSLLAGACVLLSCVTVALISAAYLLVEMGLSPAASFGIAALAGIAAGALLCLLGFAGLKRSVSIMARSRDEWSRNLESIKKILKHE